MCRISFGQRDEFPGGNAVGKKTQHKTAYSNIAAANVGLVTQVL